VLQTNTTVELLDVTLLNVY